MMIKPSAILLGTTKETTKKRRDHKRLLMFGEFTSSDVLNEILYRVSILNSHMFPAVGMN